MCGPSDAMKNLNNNIKAFAGTVTNEASQIFGDASGIFNDLKSSLSSIVKGGPSQQGWSAAQTNAVNTQIMENAAASARNVKAATGNAIAAIGGGNTPSASGLEAAVNTNAELGVEAEKSKQLSQATVQNYETGRQNYFQAVNEEAKLPSVFDSSIAANKNVMDANKQAVDSQQSIDTANNWWQPIAMGALTAGESFLTGGLSGLANGDGFMKGGTQNMAKETSGGN